MENKKQIWKRPKVTDPQGKTIHDTPHFLEEFKSRLTNHDNFKGQGLWVKKSFNEALIGQGILAGTLFSTFKKLKVQPYSIEYIHAPWEGARTYQQLSWLFHFSPLFIAPFIETLNQIAYSPVLTCFRDTQDISYFKNFSDYCAKSYPGSTDAAGSLAVEKTNPFWLAARKITLSTFKPFLESGEKLLFGRWWEVFKGSLFPLGYELGEKAYGRLTTLPGSTLCNLNKKLKLCILSSFKRNFGISSIEVDLKSCHGVIFKDIFHWEGFEKSDLPPLDNLWPSLTADFWKIFDEINFFEKEKEKIQTWKNDQIKGLLKNQFYKALNGGLPDYADDNVARSATSLGISKSEQPQFCRFFHLVFKSMKVFQLLTKFREQLNDSPILYLPNSVEGYRTSTLSKKQELKAKKNPEYKPMKLTANSRLFTTIELCLILHLYVSIQRANLPWLVVGYEADGVLVMGYFSKAEAEEGLVTLNKIFQESIRKFVTGDHILDVKNYM